MENPSFWEKWNEAVADVTEGQARVMLAAIGWPEQPPPVVKAATELLGCVDRMMAKYEDIDTDAETLAEWIAANAHSIRVASTRTRIALEPTDDEANR